MCSVQSAECSVFLCRSKSLGAVDYSTQAASPSAPQCCGCSGRLYGPETLNTAFGAFHAPCFKCDECGIKLAASEDTSCSRGGRVLCRRCYSRCSTGAGTGAGQVLLQVQERVPEVG